MSTGGHVLKGKIYHNYMIDVQVTNSKLYRRATRLLQVENADLTTSIHTLGSSNSKRGYSALSNWAFVLVSFQKLTGRPESQCEEALLKSVYQTDKLTVDITSSDISKHTQTARNRSKVLKQQRVLKHCGFVALIVPCVVPSL